MYLLIKMYIRTHRNSHSYFGIMTTIQSHYHYIKVTKVLFRHAYRVCMIQYRNKEQSKLLTVIKLRVSLLKKD